MAARRGLPFPASVLLGHWLQLRTGYATAEWLNVAFTFVLMPVVDELLPRIKHNPAKEEERDMESRLGFRVLLWLWVPMQVALLAWATTSFASVLAASGVAGAVGFVLSNGIVSGMSITVAHELGHKRVAFERQLGEMLLCTAMYGHFQIEHVQGHHWHVATPNDPATSRLNESFYRFWPRSVFGGLASAWRIEAREMRRNDRPTLSHHNRMLRYFAMQCGVLAACHALAGPGAFGALFCALQAVVGFTLLEAVNYLEHYGLQRRQRADGSYEPVDPTHSWNANSAMTNYVLFRLGRHSDHHAYPCRRYQILRSHDESPNLPVGYPSAILLALVPPLWFRVMNPKVEEQRQRARQRATKKEGEPFPVASS